LIYEVISPSGKSYIGLTGQSVNRRWAAHINKAGRQNCPNHPLYSAIRKYGAKAFRFWILERVTTREEAQAAEIQWIAMCDPQYNLSPGGDADGSTGAKRFWARMRKDPEAMAAYLQRLREGIRSSERHRAANIQRRQVVERWRKENPRKAWAVSWRNIRIANRGKQRHDPRFSKDCGRLYIKSARVQRARAALGLAERMRKHWATRKDRQRVCQNIRQGVSRHMASLTMEERRRVTEKARAAIKHTDEVKDARRMGVKRWWAELRADPERYQAVMAARIEKQKAVLAAKRCQHMTS